LNKGVDVKFRRTQLRCKLMNTFIRHNKQTLKDEKVKKTMKSKKNTIIKPLTCITINTNGHSFNM